MLAAPPSTCTAKADLVFLLDSSASIWQNNQGSATNPPDFVLEKEFIVDLINGFQGQVGPNGIQVGLIVFGTQATSDIYLNQYSNRASLISRINRIRYRGKNQQTNLMEAFIKLRTEQFTPQRGDRALVTNIVILVTDGKQVRCCQG